jgi:hypothetical protein
MSRSNLDTRRIGWLFACFLFFALLAVFIAIERAAASPAGEDPLFAQCGLENLLPAPGKPQQIAARKAKEEGRSAIAFQRWLAGAPPVLSGLLAFGVDRREWPDAALLTADDATARYCPSGARL